jgi:DNA-binding transcriptional LysR family regulator
MRLRHIEIFHAVYSTGSITNAAKVLNVSQPSVSKVLAHAEQSLGYALFERIKGKMIPTQEAERLINHVSGVYQDIGELRRVAENLKASDTGRIRIAVTPALGIDVVPGAIAAYLSDHSETLFEIETLHYREITRALVESRIDIGVAFEPSPFPGISTTTLANPEFVVLAHADVDFGTRRVLSLKDLAGMPFIKLSKRGPLGEMLDNHLETSDLKLHTVAHAETYQMAKSLVAHGAGITVVDEITGRSAGHENLVAWRLDPAIYFQVALLHLDAVPPSIVTRRFVSYLQSYVDKFLEEPLHTDP